MSLTVPVRLLNGPGNAPDAEKFMADYDFLSAIILGSFIQNGSQETWTGGTTFTNPSNGATLSDGWVLAKSGTVQATANASREATIVDSGLYSFKWNITGAGSSDSILTIHRNTVTVSPLLAETIIFGTRVLSSTANKVRLRVTDGTTTQYSLFCAGTGLWESLWAKMSVSPTASTISIYIDTTSDFTGTAYIDSSFVYDVPSGISNYGASVLTFQTGREFATFPVSGNLTPTLDNTYDIGTISLTFHNLYIGGGVVLRATGGGSNSITLKAPGTVPSSYNVIFPSAAPNNNNLVLAVSDYTTGQLAWEDPLNPDVESIIPGTDNAYDLGSSSFNWRTLYVGTSAVFRDATTHVVTVKAPTAGATYNFVFPAAAPTTNLQLLKVSDYTTGALAYSDVLAAVAEHIIPGTNNTYDLGSTSFSFRTLYVGTSIVMDDAGATHTLTIALPTTIATYSLLLPAAGPTTNTKVLGVSDYTTGTLAWVDSFNSSQSLIPSSDNTYDIGSASFNWRSIYIGTGAIYKAASGGGTVTVKGPATSAVNYNILWPAAAPTSNSVGLKVNDYTTGQLEWGTVGGGGSGATGSSDYINYVVGTPSGTYSGSTTVFDLPFSYNQNGKNIQVFYNGQQLNLTDDYTETSTTRVTTTSALVTGARIWFRSIAGAAATAVREDYIVGTPSGNYTGSLTVFALVNSYSVGGNVMMVTLDGDVQTKGASADYLETDNVTVTFNNSLVSGQRVSFIWNQTNATAGVNSGTVNQIAYYAATGATVSGAPNVLLNAAGYLKGTVIQIVTSTPYASQQSASINSSTYANIAGKAITPLSSTSKIRVTFCGVVDDTTAYMGLTLQRGTTNLGDSARGLLYTFGETLATDGCPISMTVIDSPATTSATTYNVAMIGSTSGTGYINSGIWTLEEIAG